MPPARPISSEMNFSFYRNQYAIDHNQAPEKIDPVWIKMLAEAQAVGEQNGIMPKDMAPWLLANSLTENRQNYGVNYITKNKNDQVFRDARAMHLLVDTPHANHMPRSCQKLGKLPVSKQARAAQKKCNEILLTQVTLTAHPDPANSDPAFKSDPQYNEKYFSAAKAAIVVMADKRRHAETPEKAILRWNGAGSMAQNHLKKTIETKSILNDPRNKPILDYYQNALSKAREQVKTGVAFKEKSMNDADNGANTTNGLQKTENKSWWQKLFGK